MPEKTSKINIYITRKNGVTKLKFEVDKDVVNLYAGMSEKIVESSNWEGLHFFYMPSVIESKKYREMLSNYNLFDDYGSKIISSGKFNIAWLRTQEGKGEITIKEHLAFPEVAEYIKRTTSFLKEYHESFFCDFEVEGEVKMTV